MDECARAASVATVPVRARVIGDKLCGDDAQPGSRPPSVRRRTHHETSDDARAAEVRGYNPRSPCAPAGRARPPPNRPRTYHECRSGARAQHPHIRRSAGAMTTRDPSCVRARTIARAVIGNGRPAFARLTEPPRTGTRDASLHLRALHSEPRGMLRDEGTAAVHAHRADCDEGAPTHHTTKQTVMQH